jgi:hypothetical protein
VCGYSNWTSVNGRPLTNAECVSDSGGASGGIEPKRWVNRVNLRIASETQRRPRLLTAESIKPIAIGGYFGLVGRPSFGRGGLCFGDRGTTVRRTFKPSSNFRTLLSCGSIFPPKV